MQCATGAAKHGTCGIGNGGTGATCGIGGGSGAGLPAPTAPVASFAVSVARLAALFATSLGDGRAGAPELPPPELPPPG